MEGGSWAPFSAFPAEVGAVGQLTLAELEPGVGRERGEEGTCGGETGEVWTGPDRTGPGRPLQVWPAGPPGKALGEEEGDWLLTGSQLEGLLWFI